MNKLNIELDIDPTAKFEMEEMAIRGGQAERYEPTIDGTRPTVAMLTEARRVIEEAETSISQERIEELVERVRAEQQIDVHGMVKRYFQNISLPDLWMVATDNYIKKSTERLARKRIGRNYKRKAYA